MMAVFPFYFWQRKRADSDVHYADIYGRTVAAAIDLTLIFLVLNSLFRWINGRVYAALDANVFQDIAHAHTLGGQLGLVVSTGLLRLWCISTGIQVGIIGVVYVGTQILWGTTPGKWLVGIRIVRAGTFERVRPWRYILRFLAYFPATLPLMIGVYWASFNQKRRGWHDFIAGTVVIHTRPRGWGWAVAKKAVRKLRTNSSPLERGAENESPPVE